MTKEEVIRYALAAMERAARELHDSPAWVTLIEDMDRLRDELR